MTRRCTLLTSLLLLAFHLVSNAHAQESPASISDTATTQHIGQLAGHLFIPSSFMPDPFIRTFLRTSVGFGSTINRVAPVVEVNGKTVGGSQGDLLFALFSVEYQQTVRSWLAIRGRLDVTGRLANGTPTLIAQGITLYTGFDLGWLFRLAESERYSISGSLGLKNSSTTDVLLQRFLEGVADNGAILPQNRLVQATPALRGTGGVQGVYTLTKLTGMTLAANLDYGESLTRGNPDKWYYGLAIAFDFNLRSKDGTPLGFVVGGSTGSAPDVEGADNRSAQTLFGRIAYTGADQFDLGLDIAYNYLPIRGLSDKQNFLSAVVDIRLFF